ncbi:MAG: methyltransferase domain-containing protein [Candidatus Nitrosopelagicus sp.]|nr:methyltransferase domain-containing protein [Candidatus Nitrosopelagicus sp.]
MKQESKDSKYKQRTIMVWNEVAPYYHKRWAKNEVGPFNVTNDLIKRAKIKSGQKVLDLACGTGLVTKKILNKVGKNGEVYGIDSSNSALKIAKKWVGGKKNIHFVRGDAETIEFNTKFDAITCQFALFFFPNEQRVLKNMKKFLKKNGIIALSIHGKYNVPYFDSILNPIKKFIPDYLPQYPEMDRFGTKEIFKQTLSKAGFQKIVVRTMTFQYSPGEFSDYWGNYKKYLSKPLKEKFNSLSNFQKKNLREMVLDNTKQYTQKNGKILFPWEVLVLTARNS